jgi:transposase
VIIPDNDRVRLLSQVVEGLDLSDLYSTYSRFRENQASPRQMLKILLYAYQEGIYTSRLIEKACHKNVDFMYLLEGKPAPDHTTIARFRSLHFAPCATRIMALVTELLKELGEISGKEIFIDGTKIEANANKYSFVWKKAVTKNMAKRFDRIAVFFRECEVCYDLRPVWQGKIKLKHLKKLRKKLCAIKEEEGIRFVHGKGQRKTQLQRHIEELDEHLTKIKDYTYRIHQCGERNSCSKTDCAFDVWCTCF